MNRVASKGTILLFGLASFFAAGCSDSTKGVNGGNQDAGTTDRGVHTADAARVMDTAAQDAQVGVDSRLDDVGGSDSRSAEDAQPAGDGPLGDMAMDQVMVDSAPSNVVPPALIDTSLQRTGSCGGSWTYYSQCVPGTPGRSNGCCYNNGALSTPDSTINFIIARLPDGSLELQITGYTIDSNFQAATLSGGETQPGKFVIDPAKINWPYGLHPTGKLYGVYDAGALSLWFSGTAQKSTTSYCPDESVSVSCTWE